MDIPLFSTLTLAADLRKLSPEDFHLTYGHIILTGSFDGHSLETPKHPSKQALDSLNNEVGR